VFKYHEHKDKGELADGPRAGKLARVDRGFGVVGQGGELPFPVPNCMSRGGDEQRLFAALRSNCHWSFVPSFFWFVMAYAGAASTYPKHLPTTATHPLKDAMLTPPTSQHSTGSPPQAPPAPTPSS